MIALQDLTPSLLHSTASSASSTITSASGFLTNATVTIAGSRPDTTAAVRQKLQKYWGDGGGLSATGTSSFLTGPLVAGATFFAKNAAGDIVLDAAMFLQPYVEDSEAGAEKLHFIGTASNDANSHRPVSLDGPHSLAYVLVLADPETVPAGFPKGMGFTKTGSPPQVRKHVNTTHGQKMCIVALRTMAPIPFGHTVKRGMPDAEAIQTQSDYLGNDAVSFILTSFTDNFIPDASAVLARAFAQNIADFAGFLPSLPQGATAAESPFLKKIIIDAEVDALSAELRAIVDGHARTLKDLTTNLGGPPAQVGVRSTSPADEDSDGGTVTPAAKTAKLAKKQQSALAFVSMVGARLMGDPTDSKKIIARSADVLQGVKDTIANGKTSVSSRLPHLSSN